jgi:type III secretory pathway component EscS
MRPLQLTAISGLQAPTMGLQVGALPATTALQTIDISAIMNLMLIMVVMVMMMKMMGKVTASA